jgi:hypothetical protein
LSRELTACEDKLPKKKKNDNSLCIVVHYDSHTVHTQPVRLWHHALPKAVCDMVRTQQPSDDDGNVQRYDRKRDSVPPAQHHLFKIEILMFTPGKKTPGVTRLTNSRFHERAKIAATLQTVLNPQPTLVAEGPGPLLVHLSLEIERSSLVGDVSWYDEESEADPKQECVNGEERTIVKQDAGPADDASEYSHGCCQGR